MPSFQACACLEVLDTVVSFLQTTGGAAASGASGSGGGEGGDGGALGAAAQDMLVSEYVHAVLCMPASMVDSLGSRAISQHCRLCHVDALLALLTSLAVVDPFAAVDAKYKDALFVFQFNSQFNCLGSSTNVNSDFVDFIISQVAFQKKSNCVGWYF